MKNPDHPPVPKSPDTKEDPLRSGVEALIREFGFRSVQAEVLAAGLHGTIKFAGESTPPEADEEILPEIIGRQPRRYPGPGVFRSPAEKHRLEARRRRRSSGE